ncbi:P-loop NTPase fold protein [Paraburkholderia fungorum]|uniref:P-loop NTPase fold protein n=1 Tax=Paraburkholderia fungorum TaxID=134537 RepID=UPI0038B70340
MALIAAFERRAVVAELRRLAQNPEMSGVARSFENGLNKLIVSGQSANYLTAGYSSDSVAEQSDLLDISQDVHSLASIMVAQAVSPPLAIGLSGQWGSGESFFMQEMRRRIRDLSNQAANNQNAAYWSDVVQIEFNAWHYVDTNLWASLVTFILQKLARLANRIPLGNGQRPADRIVLYIDDLDRCPAHKVVDVLQAVHLLLAYPLFVVVVGVDPRWLMHSLAVHYQEFQGDAAKFTANPHEWMTTPQHYLEKIFQIPHTLRSMSEEGYGRLIEGMLRPVQQRGLEQRSNRETQGPAALSPAPVPNVQETEKPRTPHSSSVRQQVTMTGRAAPTRMTHHLPSQHQARASMSSKSPKMHW